MIARLVNQCLAPLGLKVSRRFPPLEIQDSIDGIFTRVKVLAARRKPDFTFLQVGAFDGVTGDPIYELVRSFGWRGIVCEPNPDAFRRLEQNYCDLPKVRVENVAIDVANRVRKLYFVRKTEERMPEWIYQMGSFQPDFITKDRTGIEGVEALVTSADVNCTTIDSVLKKHSIDTLDLLQIDTEGFDFEIIKMLKMDLHKPSIIQYEHKHLSRSDKSKSAQYLVSLGYQLVFGRYDTMAFMNDDWVAGF